MNKGICFMVRVERASSQILIGDSFQIDHGTYVQTHDKEVFPYAVLRECLTVIRKLQVNQLRIQISGLH